MVSKEWADAEAAATARDTELIAGSVGGRPTYPQREATDEELSAYHAKIRATPAVAELREAVRQLQQVYDQTYRALDNRFKHTRDAPTPAGVLSTTGEPILGSLLSALVIGRAALVIAEKFGA